MFCVPNWSEEVFTIAQVKKTNPVTYILNETLGETLEGGFYEKELQKTNQELYRVEKIIRKKKIDGIELGLVKWSGYSEKHNQWLPIKNLQNI